jgi:hypothetical protein
MAHSNLELTGRIRSPPCWRGPGAPAGLSESMPTELVAHLDIDLATPLPLQRDRTPAGDATISGTRAAARRAS